MPNLVRLFAKLRSGTFLTALRVISFSIFTNIIFGGGHSTAERLAVVPSGQEVPDRLRLITAVLLFLQIVFLSNVIFSACLFTFNCPLPVLTPRVL